MAVCPTFRREAWESGRRLSNLKLPGISQGRFQDKVWRTPTVLKRIADISAVVKTSIKILLLVLSY